MRQQLRIGTSGWHYKHWLGTFYPEKLPAAKMLEFYLQHFDSVEINNSFYMLPKAPILEGWRKAEEPAGLDGEKKIFRRSFLPNTSARGRKFSKAFSGSFNFLLWELGPILFQLPPKWRVNVERFSEFLEALPKYHRYTFEFREPTWAHDEIYALLRKHKAAHCIYDWRDTYLRLR